MFCDTDFFLMLFVAFEAFVHDEFIMFSPKRSLNRGTVTDGKIKILIEIRSKEKVNFEEGQKLRIKGVISNGNAE